MSSLDSLVFLSHYSFKKKIPFIPKILYWVIRIIFAAEIPYNLKKGKNVHFSHSGLGVVVHPKAVLGNNVIIAHHVTIGGNMGSKKLPEIGNNVFVGPGAKIFGDVKVGNNVLVGANSVVLNSVPDNVVIGGIPAKKIREFNAEDFNILFKKKKL